MRLDAFSAITMKTTSVLRSPAGSPNGDVGKMAGASPHTISISISAGVQLGTHSISTFTSPPSPNGMDSCAL